MPSEALQEPGLLTLQLVLSTTPFLHRCAVTKFPKNILIVQTSNPLLTFSWFVPIETPGLHLEGSSSKTSYVLKVLGEQKIFQWAAARLPHPHPTDLICKVTSLSVSTAGLCYLILRKTNETLLCHLTD